MSAPPRFLSPFVRTRTRLALTLGLVLAALTAALLPWWHPDDPSPPDARKASDARQAGTGPRDESAAQAEARRTRKPVLVDTATTATSQTWAQPDGQLRMKITATATRAKTANGTWAAIDNRLRRVQNAARGLGVQPVNPAQPVRFSSGTPGKGADRADRSFARSPLADGPQAQAQATVLAEVDVAGHTVAYTWPGQLPEPVLDGPRALYSEVLPGVDLLLVAREEGGFAQLLIVKNKEAAQSKALATVAYGLRSKTAVFRHDASASRIAVQDGSGQEIGSIATPFAWDSSGRDPELDAGQGTPRTSVATPADVLKLSGLSGVEPGAHSAPMPMQLAGDGTGAARLDLHAAQTGLFADPDVKYPVFVDPPLKTGWAGWTVAYKPYPNTSFWNGTNFSSGTSDARVGHENDTGGTARSFWRMKYDASLKGAAITSATFKVLNNHSWSCTDREFQLWTTGAISSGTTWNKQPSWSSEIQRKSFAHGWSSSSCPDEYEAFNVKTAAQKAADGGASSLTLGMRATSESDTQTWRKFQATSATLEVAYNRPPATPSSVSSVPGGTCNTTTAGATVGKTNLVLSAKSTDPDGNLKGLRFRFWKDGAATPAGTLVTSLSSGKGSLTIASSTLVDKGVYHWDVRAEDSNSPTAVSAYYPTSGNRCTVTVDGSGPPPPTVDSDTFPEATPEAQTWASVKFGTTGAVTFTSEGASKFRWSVEGNNPADLPATGGKATLPAFAPAHAGPNTLQVYAYDSTGNPSKRTDYTFFMPPRDNADGPMDTGGDNIPDLLIVDAEGNLRTCVGGENGDLYNCLAASYGADKQPDPQGHWFAPATGKAALIAHYQDAYPGDGSTDLFAVSPDGKFWLYPGDGYGSFDVTQRIDIRLPANAPAPSTWTQIKAVGDITGDKLPDLVLRAGPAFWTLSGYTGATFHTATLMNSDAWARRDIVNVADVSGDNTPDLLWRNLDNGNMYLRHGKPGTVAGSVDLASLKVAADSGTGKDEAYGTSWTEANVPTAIGIPDVSKDGIPDIWARLASDGYTRIYNPSRTNTNAAVKVVLTSNWNTVKAFG
ncbi:DNRLRE domain-containing protein [Streptomyces sp. NPDC054884]|uniref:DNRLRE domain-containing protein n=1 Tax=Streptomyces sp. ME08-AFT2 TaxID=3028683 RepID=UPI0029A4E68A|nr:DNRLRE domain-containing protein [Streptomyces sp. ME08-AFT2]MDX3312243.1 DNRLRE domain-containing protein [Streptomyces sp. ME08-AFT2]